MFCPNCGSENSIDQRFCRACGFNLEKTAESLVEQNGSQNLSNRHNRLETLGKIGFGGLTVIYFGAILGLSVVIIRTFLLSGQVEKIIFGVTILALFVFGTIALIYVVLNGATEENRKSPVTPRPPELESPTTAKLLRESEFEPAVSVVENSTELLPVKRS